MYLYYTPLPLPVSAETVTAVINNDRREPRPKIDVIVLAKFLKLYIILPQF